MLGNYLGEVMKKLRYDHGMSQDDLASRMRPKKTRTYIAAIEAGHIKRPNKRTVEAIATALQITYAHLEMASATGNTNLSDMEHAITEKTHLMAQIESLIDAYVTQELEKEAEWLRKTGQARRTR